MFWISNTNTVLDYNVAVGGKKCYWILHHNGQTKNFGGKNLKHPPKVRVSARFGSFYVQSKACISPELNFKFYGQPIKALGR